MKEPINAEELACASLDLGNAVAKIEKLRMSGSGQEQLRFSLWPQGEIQPCLLSLTEQELVILLQAAIRAGVLSPDLIDGLQAITDI